MNAEQLERGTSLQKKMNNLKHKTSALKDCMGESAEKLRIAVYGENYCIADLYIEDPELAKMVAAIVHSKLTTELQVTIEEFERL